MTRVPEGAIIRIQPHALGSVGKVDLRLHAIREVERALKCRARVEPELALLSVRLSMLAEQISQQLWWLYDALAAREEAELHMEEEMVKARERLANIPEFVHDEGRATARGRYGIEQFQADLMRERRELLMKWLEIRREAENDVAELLSDYLETLGKMSLVTSTPCEPPTLASVLHFLQEPPAHEVIVIESTEVSAPPPRIP